MRRLRAQFDDRELTVIMGLSLLSLGLLFAWPPAALIVPGGILTVIGLLAKPDLEGKP